MPVCGACDLAHGAGRARERPGARCRPGKPAPGRRTRRGSSSHSRRCRHAGGRGRPGSVFRPASDRVAASGAVDRRGVEAASWWFHSDVRAVRRGAVPGVTGPAGVRRRAPGARDRGFGGRRGTVRGSRDAGLFTPTAAQGPGKPIVRLTRKSTIPVGGSPTRDSRLIFSGFDTPATPRIFILMIHCMDSGHATRRLFFRTMRHAYSRRVIPDVSALPEEGIRPCGLR